MAPRTRRPVIQQPETPAPPAPGHNSQFTDEQLIAENFRIEDQIKAATAKLAEWALPHKTRLKEIEDELFARLSQRGAQNTKTDSGTAYFSDILNAKVDSMELLFDYVADKWAEVGSDAKINIPVALVKQHMEDNEGKPPPGMSISYFRRLNINRS